MYNITGYKHHLCIWYIYTRLWYLSIRCFFQKDRNLKHWLQASHSLQERASKMLKQQGRIHESLVANKSRMKGYTVHQTFQISSSVVLGNHPVDILCGLASNLIFWKWEKFRTLCWMTDGPLWRTTTTKTNQQLCILLSIFTLNEGKITKSLTNIIFDSSPIILYFFRLSFIGNFVRMRHFNPARAIQLTTEMFWLDSNIWIVRYFSHDFDYFLSDKINLGFCESDFDLKMWKKLIIH